MQKTRPGPKVSKCECEWNTKSKDTTLNYSYWAHVDLATHELLGVVFPVKQPNQCVRDYEISITRQPRASSFCMSS